MFNTMAADGLARQEARASTAKLLTEVLTEYSNLITRGLFQYEDAVKEFPYSCLSSKWRISIPGKTVFILKQSQEGLNLQNLEFS